jgi:hypothetical protein
MEVRAMAIEHHYEKRQHEYEVGEAIHNPLRYCNLLLIMKKFLLKRTCIVAKKHLFISELPRS